MPLTCECDGDYDYYCEPDKDFSLFPERRGKRCESCRTLLHSGDDVLSFECYKYDEDGEERYLADQYLCFGCGGLYITLAEMGFCVTLGENLRETARQWNETYVPKPKVLAQQPAQ